MVMLSLSVMMHVSVHHAKKQIGSLIQEPRIISPHIGICSNHTRVVTLAEHIPDIRLNIISTGKLDDDGYVSNFGEGKWKLIKGSLITAKGKKKNSLYLMQAKLSNEEVNAAVNNSSIELWHKRLGHLSQKGMQLLAKKKLLPDVNGIELQTCVDCLAGKQHREQTSDDTKQSERKESTQEVPDDLDPVPPIQTDDPVPPPEARVRRSTRQTRPSTRYNPDEYVMLTDGGEPESYPKAISYYQRDMWMEAMKEEMKSLQENHTYDLVKLPKGKRTLKNKWEYKLKNVEHSSQPRYKARLVVKGFNQKKGVDFEEIFSPVVKLVVLVIFLVLTGESSSPIK
ncbi:hypothetical protein BUALT_Bualt19G0058800 [Buddleja alternifolia]|uniref:Uncharacterized protein n=1 Tax=Buddleja alternifolia TaxID=168488 RepID=A0AAV6W9R0_9LAMI|nr:hypothetical protein BUALT_Bualt19G0058800 [Buddleja alternifolia]